MKLLLLAATATAAALAAPAAAQSTPDDSKVQALVVYGDDPCPASTEDTITVCARKPESERYRIPEPLRSDPNDPRNQTWTEKATELQYVGRSGIGSCSPVGPGGMIGCFEDVVRAARAERASSDSVNWNRLIEEARQERLSRIDAEAEAVERNQ
ncbi:hypothetical protein SH591_07420 [Sphingomonas sp. LY54]|uniref:hypothetical protein n=1 Tax=Sphingomonadales TaxID=204457 RepID=UPI002ADEAA10|nr:MULTISPECIES: hypothetical protein [Sphingomonadales]MEA1013881.1 hypothetical protein [Sphingosinicella sp. LY1275]WRP29992.1 hypothetical protein SH591_07420 [Sphingomonas sp. LY54]